jgi:putative SOS response-associated peptidase YedK
MVIKIVRDSDSLPEMCGKIRAKPSWTGATAPDVSADTAEDSVVLRVMDALPVIVWDGGDRQVLPMRWGFPDPQDWRRPRPIHARAETVDTVPAFAQAFRDGQRGIVLVESFNEAPESGAQHIVMPAGPIGIAFVWRRFEIGGSPLLACVMVTVEANRLLEGLPTDRMPAVLAPEDWATWLGEDDAAPAAAKACLKTVEDVRWTMTREQRAAGARRARPTVSDPAGLF